jgi:hypothetical protein
MKVIKVNTPINKCKIIPNINQDNIYIVDNKYNLSRNEFEQIIFKYKYYLNNYNVNSINKEIKNYNNNYSIILKLVLVINSDIIDGGVLQLNCDQNIYDGKFRDWEAGYTTPEIMNLQSEIFDILFNEIMIINDPAILSTDLSGALFLCYDQLVNIFNTDLTNFNNLKTYILNIPHILLTAANPIFPNIFILNLIKSEIRRIIYDRNNNFGLEIMINKKINRVNLQRIFPDINELYNRLTQSSILITLPGLMDNLNIDRIINCDYSSYLSKYHLDKYENRVVHNGIHGQQLPSLLRILNKNIASADTTYKNELELIHDYLHSYDKNVSGHISARDFLSNRFNEKFKDKFHYHCFEILATANRYNMLQQNDTGNFELVSANYIHNYTPQELDRKEKQNGTLNIFQKHNTILAFATFTTLYPINDIITNTINNINNDLNKKKIFTAIHNYINTRKLNNRTLTNQTINDISNEIDDYFLLNGGITGSHNTDSIEDDILLYLKYMHNPINYITFGKIAGINP